MIRRSTVAIAATAALGAAAVAGPALAAGGHKNQIVAKGGTVVRPGKEIADTQHFAPAVLTVKPGAKVTLVNRSDDQGSGHTLSLIKKRLLPKTLADVGACDPSSGAKSICTPLIKAHQFDPTTQKVGQPLYNAGKPGFGTPGDRNTAGDSIYVPTKGKVSFVVSAKKGTNLYYFCAVHPWMQGEIKVR